LGAPSLARVGSGQAGEDSSRVRPITPGKGVPGLYSIMSDIFDSPFENYSILEVFRRAYSSRTKHLKALV
jgi:hypothetical protein